MATATLTTKGQVTIPKEIREGLKLQTGDKIELEIERLGTLTHMIVKANGDRSILAKKKNVEAAV